MLHHDSAPMKSVRTRSLTWAQDIVKHYKLHSDGDSHKLASCQWIDVDAVKQEMVSIAEFSLSPTDFTSLLTTIVLHKFFEQTCGVQRLRLY